MEQAPLQILTCVHHAHGTTPGVVWRLNSGSFVTIGTAKASNWAGVVELLHNSAEATTGWNVILEGDAEQCAWQLWSRGPSPGTSAITSGSVPSRSRNLIVRVMGLLERRREDLDQFLRSARSGRHYSVIRHRLFGVDEPPDEHEITVLKLILLAAIHRLATMMMRMHAKYYATLISKFRTDSSMAPMRGGWLECTYRTADRKSVV